MKILSVNYKTVGSLLKKSVKDFWLDDNKDAWFHFTDGSTVCVHILEGRWDAYMSVEKFDSGDRVCFSDSQDIMTFWYSDGKEYKYTSRTIYIVFDKVKYYYHRNFDKVTREYIPAIEFWFYEKGEEIASND